MPHWTQIQCQPRNKGKHNTFSVVITAAAPQVPQQTGSSGDKGLTCRSTCRKKRNRASVRQGPLDLTQHSHIIAGNQLCMSSWGLGLQKPQSHPLKTLHHRHLSVTVQTHSRNKSCGSVQGSRVALQGTQISREFKEGRQTALLLVMSTYPWIHRELAVFKHWQLPHHTRNASQAQFYHG